MRIIAAASVALFLALSAQSQPSGKVGQKTDWIDTAEAYFATQSEKVEWGQLKNDEERKAFIDRYWLKRDPTPGTPRNEFRDAIMDRIVKADAKYKIENTRGSETARGFVFVVFGPPARFRSNTADPATMARTDLPPAPYTGGATIEIGESYEHWTYDRERTPRLLEMVGLPALGFDFVIRPAKHIDELQSPGLAYELRDKLAARSMVNQAATGGAPAAGGAASAIAMAHPGATIPEAIGRALDNAAPPSFASPMGYFGQSTRWASAAGDPVVTLWFAATRASTISEASTRFFGRLVRPDGSMATSFSEPLHRTESLRGSAGGPVYAVELTLPPGDYTASLSVADASGKSLAEATLPVHVADRSKPLAVSSIILSPTPVRGGGGPFDLGALGLVPRADQVFSRTESLWYAGEVATAADPKTVSIDVMLRSGAKTLGTTAVALGTDAIAPGRYLFAQELPLSGFEPGDYSMYVTVRGAGGASEVRRADFRIVP